MIPETAQPPIKIALMGAGTFARDAHLPSLLNLGPLFEIVAVYSRTAAAAQALAARIPYAVETVTGQDALLARPDVEAVDIVLPIAALPPPSCAACAPASTSSARNPIVSTVVEGGAARTIRPIRATALVWMVGENCALRRSVPRAAGSCTAARSASLSPVTGRNHAYHAAKQVSSKAPGGGTAPSPAAFCRRGVHHVAAMRLILGEIAEVTAQATLHDTGLPPADTLTAALRFENGAGLLHGDLCSRRLAASPAHHRHARR